VAIGAFARVDRVAAIWIGCARQLRHLSGAEPRQLLARRHAAAEKLDVGHDGSHLRCVRRQRPAVHAPRHARIDAVFDGDLGPRARAVLRKLAIETEQRKRELPHARCEMAVGAGEIVAGIALRHVGDIGADMRIGGSDEITAPPDQKAVGIVGQRADLRDSPDLRRLRQRATGQ